MSKQNISNIPLVIFAGGQGTRMREETEFRPKPMVLLDGKPMILRIMNWYSKFGVDSFFILLGYKGDYVIKYFMENFRIIRHEKFDSVLNRIEIQFEGKTWIINLLETGLETPTGGRLLQATRYIESDHFLCTYGDAISNLDVTAQLDLYRKSNLPYLVSVAPQRSRFGEVEFEEESKIMIEFKEKPILKNLVNIGHFVLSREIEHLLSFDRMFEESVLPQLARDHNCVVYEHHGFWKSIDTLRDINEMNEIFESKSMSWEL